MPRWTEADIPDQSDRHIVVTGGNTGLGFETARALAQHGAYVTIACRSKDRAEEAVGRIQSLEPRGIVDWAPLDLADLEAVRRFPSLVGDVDVLVNNAGIMVPPFSKTDAGWESQFGVNVVGHFALSVALLPRLQSRDGRVVTLSSVAHRAGSIDFENLRGEKPYKAWREYAQSKLGDLLLAKELQRRLARHKSATLSVAAHPGVSKTELMRTNSVMEIGAKLVAQSAAKGALPTLYAATMDVGGGSYWGPGGPGEYIGYPKAARVSKAAQDKATAGRLWGVLEEATGMKFT